MRETENDPRILLYNTGVKLVITFLPFCVILLRMCLIKSLSR